MHPFDYISKTDLGDVWALLYSGMQGQGSGEKSLLAYAPKAEIKGGGFGELKRHPERAKRAEGSQDTARDPSPSAQDDGMWFGYAGYEMLHGLEDVPTQPPSPIMLPEQWWFSPTQTMSFPSTNDGHPVGGDRRSTGSCNVVALHSNLTTKRYLQIIRDTITQIHAGAFYQANITRKFYGTFDRAPDTFALFQQLCAISPSPFSAYLQFGDTAIVSSSPEGFLQITEDGRVITRPIKGSGAAGDDALKESAKDRAENLMIVDLMRNDLARHCDDVRVESLYKAHDFATIRQMISTISATRRADAIDVIKGCFPAGSMTGAPKVAAMRWIAAQEQMQRGVYSGALGWLNTAKQTADLSVVIRTLIIQGDRFEFQVGGGIVADSVPELELEETLLKARAICAVLNIKPNTLRNL
jgi:para-aminobenzoate synthetase component 1